MTARCSAGKSFFAPLVLCALVLGACSGGSSERGPNVIRLQDRFADANVSGSVASVGEIARTQWRFDEITEHGWNVGTGVEDLHVEDGRLTGRTLSNIPIIHFEHTEGLSNDDVLHAVEIRARVSRGANLHIDFNAAEELNIDGVLFLEARIPWSLTTALIPGDEFHTYTLEAAMALNVNGGGASFSGAGMRHIMLRPSDEPGAQFEIESIRLIYRQEYLAMIDSGVSWQGFESRFKETIVSRAPERASFDLSLPSRPWLDLSVATVEEFPVTFKVTASQGDQEVVVSQQTLTSAGTWQAMPIELEQFAEQQVTLGLQVSSEQPGALGFWGAPVIRNRDAAPSQDANVPQGVIVFLADTLRSDHLSTYGYERDTSPVLTRLANEGAIVLDNQSQAIWTKVSVPSIHTSLYPRTHGIRTMLDRLPAAATTLAEVYRQAGFATLALSANPFVGRGSNLHQGYEAFDESASIIDVTSRTPGKTARAYVDRLIPWISEHRDVPFFVNIHVTDPHSPYPPYRPYDTHWGDTKTRQAYEESFAKLAQADEGFFGVSGAGGGEPKLQSFVDAGVDPQSFLQQEIDWYDGSILAMDVELGRIVEALEQYGLSDDVLLVFIADHGEEFLDHDGHFHRQIYGENSNVPLVLWSPGRIPAGTVVNETVQSIDLMPTMLAMSGLALPEAAQGRSYLPLLQVTQLASGNVAYAQEAWRPQPVFTEQLSTEGGGDRGFGARDAYAVVVDGWKLVHNVLDPDVSPAPEWELFDHANDPLDQLNLADDNPEVVERLGQLLDDWLEFALASQFPEDDVVFEDLDPAELDRLRSLGYIQ